MPLKKFSLQKKKKKYDRDDAATVLVLQSVEENPMTSLRNRVRYSVGSCEKKSNSEDP